MSNPLSTNRVPRGPLPVGSDAALVVRVLANEKVPDMSVVTSATFAVLVAGSNGVGTTWTPVPQNQTIKSIDFVYVYQTHDIDDPGTYTIDCTIFAGARAVRIERVLLIVT